MAQISSSSHSEAQYLSSSFGTNSKLSFFEKSHASFNKIQNELPDKKVKHYGKGERYIGDSDPSGQRHGFGIFFFKNNEQYEGEWKNDKMNGKGNFRYESGNKYVGTFKDNLKSGFGIYYHKSK